MAAIMCTKTLTEIRIITADCIRFQIFTISISYVFYNLWH